MSYIKAKIHSKALFYISIVEEKYVYVSTINIIKNMNY